MRSLWYVEGEVEDGVGRRWWYGEGMVWEGEEEDGMVRGGGDGMGRRNYLAQVRMVRYNMCGLVRDCSHKIYLWGSHDSPFFQPHGRCCEHC